MSGVGDAYAIAVFRDAVNDLVADAKLSPLQVYAFRLFLDECEKTEEQPNYDRRIAMVGRTVDAMEALL